jgi:hypothetical protein
LPSCSNLKKTCYAKLKILHHRVHLDCEPHPVSFPVITDGCFSGDEGPERHADHSPPSVPRLIVREAIPPLRTSV